MSKSKSSKHEVHKLYYRRPNSVDWTERRETDKSGRFFIVRIWSSWNMEWIVSNFHEF